MADAADLKDRGNAAFRAGELQHAMELYSQSLALDRSSAVCYHNRAVCHLKLGEYDASLKDADEAISWNQTYAKAYSTRGTALLHLGRPADAAASFRRGCVLRPTRCGCYCCCCRAWGIGGAGLARLACSYPALSAASVHVSCCPLARVQPGAGAGQCDAGEQPAAR
jgi:tetratricopeptide (TPR) repeat protein